MQVLHAIDWFQQWLGGAAYYFVFATLVDVVAGVLLGLRQSAFRSPYGRFDIGKLPSFLSSQYGVRATAALLGMVLVSILGAGSTKDLANVAKDALVIGFATFGTKIAADAVQKVLALFGLGPVAVALRPPPALARRR